MIEFINIKSLDAADDAADQPGQGLDTYDEFDLDVFQRVANQGYGNNNNPRKRGRGRGRVNRGRG